MVPDPLAPAGGSECICNVVLIWHCAGHDVNLRSRCSHYGHDALSMYVADSVAPIDSRIIQFYSACLFWLWCNVRLMYRPSLAPGFITFLAGRLSSAVVDSLVRELICQPTFNRLLLLGILMTGLYALTFEGWKTVTGHFIPRHFIPDTLSQTFYPTDSLSHGHNNKVG